MTTIALFAFLLVLLGFALLSVLVENIIAVPALLQTLLFTFAFAITVIFPIWGCWICPVLEASDTETRSSREPRYRLTSLQMLIWLPALLAGLIFVFILGVWICNAMGYPIIQINPDGSNYVFLFYFGCTVLFGIVAIVLSIITGIQLRRTCVIRKVCFCCGYDQRANLRPLCSECGHEHHIPLKYLVTENISREFCNDLDNTPRQVLAWYQKISLGLLVLLIVDIVLTVTLSSLLPSENTYIPAGSAFIVIAIFLWFCWGHPLCAVHDPAAEWRRKHASDNRKSLRDFRLPIWIPVLIPGVFAVVYASTSTLFISIFKGSNHSDNLLLIFYLILITCGVAAIAFFVDANVRKAYFSTIQLPDHCFRCGYNLQGNTTDQCPECGNLYEKQTDSPQTHV